MSDRTLAIGDTFAIETDRGAICSITLTAASPVEATLEIRSHMCSVKTGPARGPLTAETCTKLYEAVCAARRHLDKNRTTETTAILSALAEAERATLKEIDEPRKAKR